jgi:predicted enzyme related to lactoylglutathione lyase
MKKSKPRVTGLGGIFFKTRNTKKLQAWYKSHLGLPLDPVWGGCSFEWRDAKNPKKKGATIWSAFEAKTKYFGRGRQSFMINYRVADLKKVLGQLKREGVWVDPRTEESEFGNFGWIKDGEGNRLELWEPPRQT